MNLAMFLTMLCLTTFGAKTALGESSDLSKLKEISQKCETVTLSNPTNALKELAWLVGEWQCMEFSFPLPPSRSDSYAMLGRIQIAEDDIIFPGTRPDSVLIYLHCMYTTNIAGYTTPKNGISLVEMRGKDFIYRHEDYLLLKRPQTNHPAFFLLEHQEHGNFLLFRRVKDSPSKTGDQSSPSENPESKSDSSRERGTSGRRVRE